MKYSALTLALQALRHHQGWPAAWGDATPKKSYDVIIIGGGGHGLGAAFYLASVHGISNVAVLEKGWLGGGNTARNTMTIRDNFIYPDNARFHHAAVRAWHSLSDELNFNIMLSKRGMITILMSDRDLSDAKRMVNTSALFGAEHRIIDLDELCERLPMAVSPDRLPIAGGIHHPDVVLARHDAVAWGYARAASKLGVDIIENCEVTGILRDADILEMLGPVGIMRAFTSKAHKLEYDPENVKGSSWGMRAEQFTERFESGAGVGDTIVDQLNFQISCFENIRTAAATEMGWPLVAFMREFILNWEAQIR